MGSDYLTTENLKKMFKNNFDLCNFSINIGRNAVMTNSQMTLRDVLDEIEERAADRDDS